MLSQRGNVSYFHWQVQHLILNLPVEVGHIFPSANPLTFGDKASSRVYKCVYIGEKFGGVSVSENKVLPQYCWTL